MQAHDTAAAIGAAEAPKAQAHAGSRPREQAIDIAKGIAIILVVLGHSLIGTMAAAGETPAARTATIFIYTFHMSAFFMFAGLFARSAMTEPLPDFARRLGLRIVWPYFLWGAITIVVHYLMSAYTNTTVERIDLVSMLWAPPAVFWFLYGLALAMIVARMIRGLPQWLRIAIAFALYAASYGVSAIGDPALASVTLYLRFGPSFLLGLELGAARARAISGNAIVVTVAVMVMAVELLLAWQAGQAPMTGYPGDGLQFAPALLAGPVALLALARLIESLAGAGVVGWLGSTLAWIGQRTMPIFVIHILLTAGLRIALMKFLQVDNIPLVIGISLVLATAVPLALYEVARRLRITPMLGWR